MVLRGLLARKRHELKLFRASARLTGFAQQLSQVLRELQRHQLTPEALLEVAGQVPEVEGLAYKLQDLATLLRDYLEWLRAHDLQDDDSLLAAAVQALGGERGAAVPSPESGVELGTPRSALRTGVAEWRLNLDQFWVDGFAEWSSQELDLLAALAPHCRQATLTFCLDRPAVGKLSWLSNWSVVRKAFEECQRRFASLPEAEIRVETLSRHPSRTRFLNNPVLQRLEQCWAEPEPAENLGAARAEDRHLDAALRRSLRVALCSNPEAEVTLAAREILRHVRAGGRYREVTVLVRKLEGYHEPSATHLLAVRDPVLSRPARIGVASPAGGVDTQRVAHRGLGLAAGRLVRGAQDRPGAGAGGRGGPAGERSAGPRLAGLGVAETDGPRARRRN